MKRLSTLFAFLIPVLLLTGCMKEDIDELRRRAAEAEGRIAALEQWSQSVNNNISALQALIAAVESNDFVSGVTPVMENGQVVGYTITFTKSGPVTIYHGTDGVSPVIKVALDSDGKYYWQVDTGNGFDWIYDNGSKIGATGVPPLVKIDTDTNSATYGEWLVSTDDGANWTSTGVQAQGDSIFAPDGIDYDDDEFVIFTLADGVTKIRVPKYKSIGIKFDQPGEFAPGIAQEIIYTNTGNLAPMTIRVKDLPSGWRYDVDYTDNKIIITPPATFTAENAYAEATVQVGDDDQVVFSYWLTAAITGVGDNRMGAIYFRRGIPDGVVYIANDGTTGSGRVVSLVEANTQTGTDYGITWGFYGRIESDDENNGLANMEVFYDLKNKGYENFPPVYQWCDALNGIPGETTYGTGLTGVWYIPAKNELKAFYAAISGVDFDVIMSRPDGYVMPGFGETLPAREDFNTALSDAGGTTLQIYAGLPTGYWSSTEADGMNSAWRLNMYNGAVLNEAKGLVRRVRAILAF